MIFERWSIIRAEEIVVAILRVGEDHSARTVFHVDAHADRGTGVAEIRGVAQRDREMGLVVRAVQRDREPRATLRFVVSSGAARRSAGSVPPFAARPSGGAGRAALARTTAAGTALARTTAASAALARTTAASAAGAARVVAGHSRTALAGAARSRAAPTGTARPRAAHSCATRFRSALARASRPGALASHARAAARVQASSRSRHSRRGVTTRSNRWQRGLWDRVIDRRGAGRHHER